MSVAPDGTETTVHQEWRVTYKDDDGEQFTSSPRTKDDADFFLALVAKWGTETPRVQVSTVTTQRTKWRDA